MRCTHTTPLMSSYISPASLAFNNNLQPHTRGGEKGKTSLESLPAEVKLMILCQLAKQPALHALINASAAYNLVFQNHSPLVQTAVLFNSLQSLATDLLKPVDWLEVTTRSENSPTVLKHVTAAIKECIKQSRTKNAIVLAHKHRVALLNLEDVVGWYCTLAEDGTAELKCFARKRFLPYPSTTRYALLCVGDGATETKFEQLMEQYVIKRRNEVLNSLRPVRELLPCLTASYSHLRIICSTFPTLPLFDHTKLDHTSMRRRS